MQQSSNQASLSLRRNHSQLCSRTMRNTVLSKHAEGMRVFSVMPQPSSIKCLARYSPQWIHMIDLSYGHSRGGRPRPFWGRLDLSWCPRSEVCCPHGSPGAPGCFPNSLGLACISKAFQCCTTTLPPMNAAAKGALRRTLDLPRRPQDPGTHSRDLPGPPRRSIILPKAPQTLHAFQDFPHKML